MTTLILRFAFKETKVPPFSKWQAASSTIRAFRPSGQGCFSLDVEKYSHWYPRTPKTQADAMKPLEGILTSEGTIQKSLSLFMACCHSFLHRWRMTRRWMLALWRWTPPRRRRSWKSLSCLGWVATLSFFCRSFLNWTANLRWSVFLQGNANHSGSNCAPVHCGSLAALRVYWREGEWRFEWLAKHVHFLRECFSSLRLSGKWSMLVAHFRFLTLDQETWQVVCLKDQAHHRSLVAFLLPALLFLCSAHRFCCSHRNHRRPTRTCLGQKETCLVQVFSFSKRMSYVMRKTAWMSGWFPSGMAPGVRSRLLPVELSAEEAAWSERKADLSAKQVSILLCLAALCAHPAFLSVKQAWSHFDLFRSESSKRSQQPPGESCTRCSCRCNPGS